MDHVVPVDREYCSPAELSTLTGIPEKTLEVWRSRRLGPPFLKISRRMIRYPLREATEWLESHRVEAA